jgi:hypothetical protein
MISGRGGFKIKQIFLLIERKKTTKGTGLIQIIHTTNGCGGLLFQESKNYIVHHRYPVSDLEYFG